MGKATATGAGASMMAARQVRIVVVGMAITVLAAIGATAANAQPMGGMGMHHHGGMGGGGMMFGGSPERMGRMVDHMLDGLNATDAQRSQIKSIAAAAAADVRAQMQASRGLRERGMQAFTAPNVDAGAAEQVRQQMLQQHDQVSRRMTQAMVDIARVLTPEQRARIGERMRDRQARMEERMKRFEREQPRR